jgi:hypothetical protein
VILRRHSSGPFNQVSGYIAASRELDAEAIAADFRTLATSAPTRSRNIVAHNIGSRKVASNRREERLAHRLYEVGARLRVPGWEPMRIVDFQMPLNAARGDGLGKVDLLGAGDGLCVIELKVASGRGNSDTPLNALLEAVGYTAVVRHNEAAIRTELGLLGVDVVGSSVSALVLGPPDYWQRWDRTRQRVDWRAALATAAATVTTATGIEVRFGSLDPDLSVDVFTVTDVLA